MPSSTSSFERTIPDRPWRGIALVTLLIVTLATIVWEVRCRMAGYGPTLNDSADLWAQRFEKVRPDSVVIIGDSRPWFDLDLDVLEQGFGQRPLQLAIPGSCAFPILDHFSQDQNFRGTIICSILPALWIVPAGLPPTEISRKALERAHTWTLAQRASHELGMLLEEHVAFLKQDDLTLGKLLEQLPIPNRPYARVPPPLPPYFQTSDRERRARMFVACEQPGPLQERVRNGWLRLFQLPKPPSYVPPEAFAAGFGQAIEARMRDTVAAVARLREHGARVVFVRFPVTGPLLQRENELTPRAQFWDRIVRETQAPAIHFADHPDLASFDCPEWSHLSDADSVEFTKRLVLHLKAALGR